MSMVTEIVDFIKSAVRTHGYSGAVIGISGGIDSAVVGALTVQAIGNRRVLGVILPERDSAPETLRDSHRVCNHLGIERIVKPITPILRSMGVYRLQPPTLLSSRRMRERYVMKRLKALGGEDVFLRDLKNDGDSAFCAGLAYYRVKHRIRMACLYLEGEKRNYAVMGTTNRTEARTGLYVKWGDAAADMDPIAHLYKTQVYRLAEELGIPDGIRSKKPSPDLIPGVTDEWILGMTYSELDRILMALDQGKDLSYLSPEKVERVRKILAAAPHRGIRNLSIKGTP